MIADQQEVLNTLILSRIGFYSLAGMLELYRRMGTATAIMEHRKDIRSILPDAPSRLIALLQESDSVRRWAEEELEWAVKNQVEVLCLHDERYPKRLAECPDAPLALFYQGTASLNQMHIVSMVGTRHCTIYGQDLVRNFMVELHRLCPNTLVVSGLAYGIDIQAHRQALQNSFETVAVLAHGLDQIYPRVHQETAQAMLHQGGLLTEYATHTNADKQNFVRRNRIVAGLCDACILVESAEHGGGRITTRLANDYNRDVFAFPGAVNMPYSMGCNTLIRDNKAALITSAFDFVQAMDWGTEQRIQDARQRGIERQLFPDLTAEEQQLVTLLAKDNDQQINVLTVRSGQPVAHLISLLFQLELKGVVKALPGGCYHLLC